MTTALPEEADGRGGPGGGDPSASETKAAQVGQRKGEVGTSAARQNSFVLGMSCPMFSFFDLTE